MAAICGTIENRENPELVIAYPWATRSMSRSVGDQLTVYSRTADVKDAISK